jgi:hypothetical protein
MMMARKPNYEFERRERARQRAEKKANRAAAKAEAKKAKAEQSQPLDSETANPPSPDS